MNKLKIPLIALGICITLFVLWIIESNKQSGLSQSETISETRIESKTIDSKVESKSGLVYPKCILDEIQSLGEKMKKGNQQKLTYKWLKDQLSDGYWHASTAQKSDDVELTSIVCILMIDDPSFGGRSTLKAPIRWLIKQQEEDGSFGVNAHQTALAVWALALALDRHLEISEVSSNSATDIRTSFVKGLKWGQSAQIKNSGWPQRMGGLEPDVFSTFCWTRAFYFTPRELLGFHLDSTAHNNVLEVLCEYAKKTKELNGTKLSLEPTFHCLSNFYSFSEPNVKEQKLENTQIEQITNNFCQNPVTSETIASLCWIFVSRLNVYNDSELEKPLRNVHTHLVSSMNQDGYWKFPAKNTVRNYEKEAIGQTVLATYCAQSYLSHLAFRIRLLYASDIRSEEQKKEDKLSFERSLKEDK
jgi:hypothetical protein